MEKIKEKFIESDFDIGSMEKVMLYSPTYINWETGIFGERALINGTRNPNATQLIILSKIDFKSILEKNPHSAEIINKYREDKDIFKDISRSQIVIDAIFIIMNCLIILTIIIGLIVWNDLIILYYKISDRRASRKDKN